MSHRVLCLVNAAASCRPYFEQLAPQLEARGFSVGFVLDSHLTDVLYADGKALEGAWYFTDFVRTHIESGNSPAASARVTWSDLFPDFDRFLAMGIAPPLNPGGPLGYESIPALLEAFFEHVLRAEQPCAFVYEQASNSFALAACRAAMRIGIPFCSIAPARIPGRIEISLTGALKDYRTIGRILDASAQRPLSTESMRIAREYRRNIETQIPDYMKPSGSGRALAEMGLRRRYLRKEKFAYLARAWKYRTRFRDDCRLAYQHGDPLLLSRAYVVRALKRRMRYPLVQPLYKSDPGTRPYFLYPLHFHPEASTSVFAPDFNEELSVIKSVAFRLPAGMILAVKEHPSAVALQPLEFYRQLSTLPNVVLLSADLSAKSLARQSCGVICITSTLGLEAAVMNRPVVALGDVLYGYFPNVRMIESLAQLPDALEWALTYRPLPEDQLDRAMAAYVEYTATGSFDFRGSLGDSAAIGRVADLLLERIGAPGIGLQ